MRQLNEKTGIPSLTKAGKYHLRMLETNSLTQDMVSGFKVLYDEFSNAVNILEDAEFEVSIVTARIKAADMMFDTVISRINSYLLAKLHNDRDNKIYRGFFPEGRISETIKTKYDKLSFVFNRIKNASENSDLVPENLIVELEKVTEEINTLIDELSKTQESVANAHTAMIIAKLPFIKAYNMNYGELLTRFEGNKRFCDSFFMSFYSKSKEEPAENTEEISVTADA